MLNSNQKANKPNYDAMSTLGSRLWATVCDLCCGKEGISGE